MMNRMIKIGIATMMAALLLIGCGKNGAQGEGAGDVQPQADTAGYVQVTLNELTMMYDPAVWSPTDVNGTENMLRFDASDNGVLGISRAVEGMYQHPLDMIAMAKQIYSGYEGFATLSEPVEVETADGSWYEWSYQYMQDGAMVKSLQRVYGKNYYAYSLSYVSDETGYDVHLQSAKDAMNTVEVKAPDNTRAEEKAKEFLVGEWDMGDSGYLVLEKNGTYTWFMDNSKDKNNMHTGTYGCDVQNTSLGFVEGEGVYLVLFPEKLMVEGQANMTGSVKYDYGIMLKQETEGVYQMLNVNSFTIYELVKQK